MSEILVIGFGSIGARHARVARGDGHNVTVVSRRNAADAFPCRQSIAEAVGDGQVFDCAIVASETGRHLLDLETLVASGFTGRILVEKPVFAASSDAHAIPASAQDNIRVAYNLRFHPLLIDLRERLQNGARVLNVVVHVGQDLHQWRTGRPIEQTYSSQKSGGGGVLRDLSHELDYLIWMLGPWRSVCATGGRVGDLPGDADDCWGILLHFDSGAMVTLALDYFCRRPVRTVVANTSQDTIHLDLVRGVRTDTSGETRLDIDRDFTYQAQLRALLAGESSLCNFDQGVAVLGLIEAIEESAASGLVVLR